MSFRSWTMVLGILDGPNKSLNRFFDRFGKSSFSVISERLFEPLYQNMLQISKLSILNWWMWKSWKCMADGSASGHESSHLRSEINKRCHVRSLDIQFYCVTASKGEVRGHQTHSVPKDPVFETLRIRSQYVKSWSGLMENCDFSIHVDESWSLSGTWSDRLTE